MAKANRANDRTAEFSEVFARLKKILKPYEKRCLVEKDSDTDYYLNTKQVDAKGKPIFFAAACIHKISVSFYLMALYYRPELAKGISPQLKKRLQGKTCFHFTQVEPEVFKELAALTKKGFTITSPV